MGTLGWIETVIVGGIILLLFGARRLPEVAGGLGRAFRTLKKPLDSVGVSSEDSGPNNRGSFEQSERAASVSNLTPSPRL